MKPASRYGNQKQLQKTVTASKSKRDAAFDGLRKASYATESNKPEDIVACLGQTGRAGSLAQAFQLIVS
jgi:hypothetical protein